MFVLPLTRLKYAIPLVFALVLAGCETAEERAAGHFEAAQELAETGDVQRAFVELRNVFKLNNEHQEARRLFGALLREQGDIPQAYRQYVRLVEQVPQDVDGLREVSELALIMNNLDDAERYVARGFALAPEDISFRAMNALMTYRTAVNDGETAVADAQVVEARDVLAEDDAQFPARQVVIDSLLKEQNLTAALVEIDAGLQQAPRNLQLHEIKLRVLNGLDDSAALGAHLEAMITEFPENERVRSLLIRWYINENKLDDAEAFLRQLAQNAPAEERRAGYVTLIQFLRQIQGAEAGAAEVDARIASGEDVAFFRTMRAAMRFEAGEQAAAIEELQAVIATDEASDDIRDAKATLAQMLESTGDNVGARNLVEEVLAENARHVRALQMKATWQIEEDRAGEAVQSLRVALDQEPRNATTLTLMARAHMRDGSRDLAGERLALAVDVTDNAVPESIRYAQFLVGEGREAPAEEVLVESLRSNPSSLLLLQALGDLYMRQSDWLRTQSVVDQMIRLNTDAAARTAQNLQADLLQRQGKVEESLTYLQNITDSGDTSLETAAMVVQGHMRNGDLAQAQDALDALLEDYPDNTSLRLVRASLHGAVGELDQAEGIFRDLVQAEPANEPVVLALYTFLRGVNRLDEARQVIEDGITAAAGNAPRLQTVKAGLLEQDGDIDGAIAIYEELYAQFSNSTVLANNLASLITTYRDDAESLERAFRVARRLRGVEVPAFQDTYGWIEYRRGNYEEAVRYLEPAAAGLQDDPVVQMHLGLAYVATEQFEKARATLQQALDMAGDEPNPRLEMARTALDDLPPPPSDDG